MARSRGGLGLGHRWRRGWRVAGAAMVCVGVRPKLHPVGLRSVDVNVAVPREGQKEREEDICRPPSSSSLTSPSSLHRVADA